MDSQRELFMQTLKNSNFNFDTEGENGKSIMEYLMKIFDQAVNTIEDEQKAVEEEGESCRR